MPVKHEVIRTKLPDMTVGGFNFAIRTITDSLDPSTAVTKPVVEGSNGKTGYTFMIISPNKGSKDMMKLVGSTLRHYRDRYPEGIKAINGQIIPSAPSDLNRWATSIWTNYGEKKVPFDQDPNWDIIVSDVAQEREVNQSKALKAISYVKVETPFARFGFDLIDGTVNNFSVAATISDTSGFMNLVAALTDGISEENIKEFFEKLTASQKS